MSSCTCVICRSCDVPLKRGRLDIAPQFRALDIELSCTNGSSYTYEAWLVAAGLRQTDVGGDMRAAWGSGESPEQHRRDHA